jgi:hemolysin activation/secretion protein
LYSRQQKLNVLGMFDLINSATYLSSSGTTPNSKDFLRVLRVGADYALLDTYFGPTRSAVNQANIRVSHGIQGLGSSHSGSTSLGRQGSVFDFTKVNVELSRNQTLFSPWADATVGLLTLVTGQGSRNVLPSAEGFYLGGMRFTRGFYSGEVTGDNALAATAELQLNTTVQTSITGSPREIGLQYYGFYDWGQTWQNRALDTNQRLRSFGLGIRAALSQSLEFDIEGVYRLTRQPTGSSSAVKPLGGQAVYWRLVARY